jgi:hypothetical protein
LQQTPLVAAMGESMENKDSLLRASPIKWYLPSIMGISREYEDMAKKIQSYSVIWRSKGRNR